MHGVWGTGAILPHRANARVGPGTTSDPKRFVIANLRFAFRQIAKNPGFAIVTILTLAIGIGANTAIFSIVNAVLLEPLPYPHSDRLVQVCEMPAPGNYNTIASGGAFADWQDASTQLESIAAAHPSERNLTGFGEPVRLQGLEVSADYLHVFGITPALGRDFIKSEDSASGDHDVVILSHEFWQSRLGGETGIVGKRIRLDGKSLLVIGVLSPHALFANDASFLTPSVIRPSEHHMSRDYNYVVSIVGRLKPGSTAAQAAEELTVAKRGVRSLYPVFKQKWTVGVLSLHEEIFGDMRPYVLTLFGAVAVVLLIACANVANLLLARATVRQTEIAVRVALGATSRRIVCQLLTESLVLALAGGVAGLVVGELAIRPLVAFAGISSTVGGSIGINARVLAFTLIASVATGVLFGLVPALSATKQDVSARLKEGARGSTAGSHRTRYKDLWLPGVTKAIGEKATPAELLDIANGSDQPGDAVYQVARWDNAEALNDFSNLVSSVNGNAAALTAGAVGSLLADLNVERAMAFAMGQATDSLRSSAIAGVMNELGTKPNGDAQVRSWYASLPSSIQTSDPVLAAYGDSIWASDPAGALQALQGIADPRTKMIASLVLANNTTSSTPETAIAAIYESGLTGVGIYNHVNPILQDWYTVNPQAASNFISTTQIIPPADVSKYAPIFAPRGGGKG